MIAIVWKNSHVKYLLFIIVLKKRLCEFTYFIAHHEKDLEPTC